MTEATGYALRLERAFTRRDKNLEFEGGYHGRGDEAQYSPSQERGMSNEVVISHIPHP